jgi:hypothetical protein
MVVIPYFHPLHQQLVVVAVIATLMDCLVGLVEVVAAAPIGLAGLVAQELQVKAIAEEVGHSVPAVEGAKVKWGMMEVCLQVGIRLVVQEVMVLLIQLRDHLYFMLAAAVVVQMMVV